jgi:hypothetical protein
MKRTFSRLSPDESRPMVEEIDLPAPRPVAREREEGVRRAVSRVGASDTESTASPQAGQKRLADGVC